MYIWLGTVGVGLVAVWLFVSKKKAPQKGPLKSIQLPAMGHVGALILATVLHLPIIGPILSKLLYKLNGFDKLRDIWSITGPSFIPVVIPAQLPPSNLYADEYITVDQFLNDLITSQPYDSHNPNKVPHLSIQDYANAYRTHKITPLQVATQCCAAIEASNTGVENVRAFSQYNLDDILKQGQNSTNLYLTGKPRSCLEGVPIIVKDEFAQIGYASTVGTPFFPQKLDYDAPIIQKLRAMGCMFIGRGTMHPCGLSTIGFNIEYGTPRNPYDPSRYCGGSSCGPAAAVSSGICPIAVAADGAGSTRIPAGCTGMVGMKPTWARITGRDGFPLCESVVIVGPIASNVFDCAVAYAIQCGPDTQNWPTTVQPPPKMYNFYKQPTNPKPFQGLRVGVYDAWASTATPDMYAAYTNARDAMVAFGATLVPVDQMGEILEPCRLALTLIISSEMLTSVYPFFKSQYKQIQSDVGVSFCAMNAGSQCDYLAGDRVRTMAIGAMKGILQKVDVILLPNTGQAAPVVKDPQGEIDLTLVAVLMSFQFLANFVGLPSIAFPYGYSNINEATGVCTPTAVQVMGRWWDEHLLFKIASVMEKQTPKRQPKLFYKYF